MWSRFDDQITHHPKILKAGIRAAYLYFAGIIYCSRYRTDGYIPKEALATLAPMRDHKRLARTLVEVRVPSSEHGLWEEVEGGYRVHDFLVYQPTAASLAQREEADRKRLRAARSAGRSGSGDVVATSDGGDEHVEGEPLARGDKASPVGVVEEPPSLPAPASETARRSDVAATPPRRHGRLRLGGAAPAARRARRGPRGGSCRRGARRLFAGAARPRPGSGASRIAWGGGLTCS